MNNPLLTTIAFQSFMKRYGKQYQDQTTLEIRLPTEVEQRATYASFGGIEKHVGDRRVILRDPRSPEDLKSREWTVSKEDAQQMFGKDILDKIDQNFSTHGVKINMRAMRITKKFVNALAMDGNIVELSNLPRDNNRQALPQIGDYLTETGRCLSPDKFNQIYGQTEQMPLGFIGNGLKSFRERLHSLRGGDQASNPDKQLKQKYQR